MNGKTPGFNVIGQLAALKRYAMSLVRNPDDADDLVHDALVRAYERQSTFRPDANVRNWLMSILHNAHIDRLRRRRSETRRHDAAADLAERVMPANQDHSVRLTQLRNAFFALPEEQRAALHLVAIEELSYQEAADTLGIPVGTLMSRVARAREKLRTFERGVGEQGAGATVTHLRLVGGTGDDKH